MVAETMVGGAWVVLVTETMVGSDGGWVVLVAETSAGG